MRRVLTSTLPQKIGSLVLLEEGEAKHLTSVLRLGPGDEILTLDGSGVQAKASLVFRDKKVFAELLEQPHSDTSLLSLPIHLHMSVIKGDAMEWVIEKATELGVRSLTPVETEFCVVKMQKRGVDTFQERWQRIADQALKQCGRLDRMIIHAPQTFEDSLRPSHPLYWLDESLAQENKQESHLAKLLEDQNRSSEFALLIGPEGGFSASERNRLLQLTGSEKHEIRRAGLGSIILRAETAAILGVSILVGNHYGKRKN